MREISRTLAAHLPAGSAHARLADEAGPLAPDELVELARRAAELASAPAGAFGGTDLGRELDGLFARTHSIVTDAAAGLGCEAGEQALLVPRLVGSVLRPLAAIAGTLAGQDASAGGQDTAGQAAPPGPPGTAAARVWEAAKTATALRARLGRSGSCPPELAEAVAALQDLACRLVSPADAAARLDRAREPAGRTRGDAFRPCANGPYLVTNAPQLTDYLGAARRPAPQLALCRCGASAIKPLCDGSHARIGFTDAKDPKRVPDRRDTYAGQQLTIFDNRGICQHSGFCSDRLATVFRAGVEPFVAPSGGRMDEIIRAVRDCPSGALSYAVDGVEARDQVDRHDVREPGIEVSKDGPYRITGKIPLTDAEGNPAARTAGSSLEHYALCRCGHSQNKPFCSGMHWYVGFQDPVPPRRTRAVAVRVGRRAAGRYGG